MDCNNAIDFIPDLDDCTQQLKENPPDLREDIRQEHETWLAELEGLAVEALASGIWEPVYSHIASFPDTPDVDDGIADPIAMLTEVTRLKTEASADSLSGSSADTQTTEVNESIGVTQ
jgi:hypothetical protein